MDDTERQAVAANLFPAAHGAITDWEAFDWHRDGSGRVQAHKVHSSQALALDVFGAIATSDDRDAVMAILARQLQLPEAGPWTLEFEWTDPVRRLGEPRPTQVDVLARSPEATLVIECKFTEPGGGCSQVKPRNLRSGGRQPQCNGRYEPQVNPVNGIEASCALTAKGIRYWEVATEVFELDRDAAYNPCPFRRDAFQWMRNLVLARELQRDEGRPAGVLVVYAAHPNFPTHRKATDLAWLPAMLPDAPRLVTLPFQDVVRLAAGQSQATTWPALAEWVDQKVAAAAVRSSSQKP